MPPVRRSRDVRHQRGRVHRHQRVDRVAGRVDVLAGEMDLETGDAGLGAARGANFGREVGERGDVVADQRADVLVNCVPASCMPSPESPQKRTVASSIF